MKTKNRAGKGVSVKAYSDFVKRLEMTLTDGCGNEAACKEAVEMLDRYIAGDMTHISKDSCSDAAWIAFSMIRSEVDKAMRRSRMARERALLRKAAKTGGGCESATAACADKDANEKTGDELSLEEEAMKILEEFMKRSSVVPEGSERSEESDRSENSDAPHLGGTMTRRERRALKQSFIREQRRMARKEMQRSKAS